MKNAIDFFKEIKRKQTKWYMGNDRVSLAMMAEQESFVKKCDWAIKTMVDRQNEKM